MKKESSQYSHGMNRTEATSGVSLNKKMSQMSELEQYLQNGDLKRTYHANFAKQINTESDCDSDITDLNKIEYHKVGVVSEGHTSSVYKAVNLKSGKSLAIKCFNSPNE